MQRLLLPLVWIGVAVLIPLSLARAAYLTIGEMGALDLHPYWYYGHFVRMGINPYSAFAESRPLPQAARYLDGSIVPPESVKQPHLEIIPGHTASTLLLSAWLSYIPWQPLKYGWFLVNLVMIAAVPWLTLRLLPLSLRLTPSMQWLAALSFYATKGPRFALSNGQPSILIFFLMILVLLLRKRYWIFAGLALGLALGKYSLSLPVVIYLLFEKQLRVVALAVLVQAISLIAVAMLAGGSLWQTLQHYWNMIVHFSGPELGVHLGYLLYDYPRLLIVLLLIGTLVTFGVAIARSRRGLISSDLLPLNSLLSLWILLAVYHRSYDTILTLFFFVLCLSALSTWQLSLRQRYSLGLFWLLSLFWMCLPGEIVNVFLSDAQSDTLISWIEKTMIVAVVVMWGVNVWLVGRVPRVGAAEAAEAVVEGGVEGAAQHHAKAPL